MKTAVLDPNAADMALVQRLFDLSNTPGSPEAELAQLDADVYGRLYATYDPVIDDAPRIAA